MRIKLGAVGTAALSLGLAALAGPALAEERLDDLKAAYADYQKAVELKPDWAIAKTELARFHVVQH